jgi:V8-like Glu-specific endopeptidase
MRNTNNESKNVVVAVMGISLYFAAATLNASVDLSRVIYGEDGRMDAKLHPNAKLKELSKSVAGRLRKSSAEIVDGQLILENKTLEESMGVCSSERFATQKTVTECTGFLIADDLLVTAGHCVRTNMECANFSWVFDFHSDVESIPTSKIYDCKEIVAQEFNASNDFAVLRLDRKVEGRTPLKLRKEGTLNPAQDGALAVIGHPSGLPLKIEATGILRDVNEGHDFFIAELDTYGGNSGSPVFNLRTNEVEGILVRGERDYVMDMAQGCAVSNVCEPGSCRGEDVQKITSVRGLDGRSAPVEATPAPLFAAISH